MPNVGAGNRTFSGSVEFLNYIYLNGVLAHIDQDQDTILSGTVNFNVTFDNSVDNSGNGASTAAFSSATAIAFDGRSAGPLTVQFAANGATPAIERNVASNRDTVVTIRDLVVTFESDLTNTTINTIDDATGAAASLSALANEFPTLGAIEFQGGNSGVRILSNTPSSGLGVLRLSLIHI